MKKVALTANTSWYLLNFKLSTIKLLKNQGYEVYCIAPKDDYSEKLKSVVGDNFFELRIEGASTNIFTEAMTLLDLYRIYKVIEPDLVLSFTIKNNVYSAICAYFLKFKLMPNISGLGTAFLNNGMVNRIVRLLYRAIDFNSDKVFYQNKDDGRYLVNEGLISDSKMVYLPGSGIDTDKFNKDIAEPVSSEKSKVFRFIYVGRLLKDKGVIELLEAAKNLHKKGFSFELYLYGDITSGNNSSLMKEDILKYDSECYISFKGHEDNIINAYLGSDCIVLPSYREGLPRSVAEANSMKIPALVTNVPGCRELIRDNVNGFLFEVKNVADIVHKMELMLGLSKYEREALGKSAREIIKNDFSEEIILNLTISEVNKLLV